MLNAPSGGEVSRAADQVLLRDPRVVEVHLAVRHAPGAERTGAAFQPQPGVSFSTTITPMPRWPGMPSKRTKVA